MKIYLVRHGESTSDIENRYGGDYDDDLTEKGYKQAQTLAQTFATQPINIILSSPRIRARQTADALYDVCKCKVEHNNDLRERNFYGILTGLTKDEAAEKYPEIVPLLLDRKNTLPDGESYDHFLERIASAWGDISNLTHDSVVVVTHGGPIRCIFRDVLGKGELSHLGDCAMFELSDKTGTWEVISTHNANFE